MRFLASGLVGLQLSSGRPCKCQNVGTEQDPSQPDLVKTLFSSLSVSNSRTHMRVQNGTKRPEGENETENDKEKRFKNRGYECSGVCLSCESSFTCRLHSVVNFLFGLVQGCFLTVETTIAHLLKVQYRSLLFIS